MSMVTRSKITSVGSYLPPKVVTNYDLEKIVDTSHDWIVQRTGIEQRYLAEDDVLTSDLAIEAARKCLSKASIGIEDIDMIIVATTTPDRTFPATATRVQAQLGMERGCAFDVQAVCAGFIYGLSIADQFIKSGSAKHIMVIGAETFSRILDWNDRRTCVLFGDGAGAVILSAFEDSGDVQTEGILSTHLFSDGRYIDILCADGGPSLNRSSGVTTMVGQEVFKSAVKAMSDSVFQALEKNKLSVSDIDWFIPHQANSRILEAVGKRIGLDEKNLISTVSFHANTSAASIPLALDYAVSEGHVKKGQLVALSAFGAGLSWGSSLLRW
jgi:3-oxoacyl-[acyl-carrier-protein] synthase-3